MLAWNSISIIEQFQLSVKVIWNYSGTSSLGHLYLRDTSPCPEGVPLEEVLYFGFALLCSVNDLKRLVPPIQPIRYKTNPDLVQENVCPEKNWYRTIIIIFILNLIIGKPNLGTRGLFFSFASQLPVASGTQGTGNQDQSNYYGHSQQT